MNTVKSFWVGMGALCIAGGGAYYFAKKSIVADRQARYEEEQNRRRRTMHSLEHSTSQSSRPSTASHNTSRTSQGSKTNGGPPQSDHSGSPSQEATSDPAPTRHAPESEGQRVREKSKYEASDPYRSKKGDRFS